MGEREGLRARSGVTGSGAAHSATGPLTALVLATGLPLMTSSEFVLRVGVNIIVFALLAVGLNVVVGYAGLLDLGYVAFFGISAYAYALLASDQLGVHLPTLAVVPIAIAATCLIGLLVALPSRRLVGDYLAILTLFFGQIFLTLTTTADRITFPGTRGTTELTGGPNGIVGLDDMQLLGFRASSTMAYYYVGLGALAFVLVCVHSFSLSPTGRGLRTLREDALAAELMGVPVHRLRFVAFAIGAAIAGLAGTLFAAVEGAVFPQDFGLPVLITIYVIVMLGGAGSLTGVVVGATLLTVVLETLREPSHARALFYATIVIAVLAYVRPLKLAAAVLGGSTTALIATDALALAFGAEGSSDAWPALPHTETVGNLAFLLAVGVGVLMTVVGTRARVLLVAPLLYLLVLTWENRLVEEPSITRFLLLGALLVLLMTARPEGLLGKREVEIPH